MSESVDGREAPKAADAVDAEIVEAPTTLGGIVRRLGPGLIIAGSIVGSGELIATTKTGAQAGISLLWLILIGCLIKVFVQVELGRYAISHGETTLSALNRVPGPRFGANWIMWLWLIMMICIIGQLGGIVGGVGQALALTVPFKGDYQQAVKMPSVKEFKRYVKWEEDQAQGQPELKKLPPEEQKRILRGQELLGQQIDRLGKPGQELLQQTRALVALESGQDTAVPSEDAQNRPAAIAELSNALKDKIDPFTLDDKYWSAVVAVFTAALLYVGRYNMIQTVSMVLVVSFTFVTIGNVIMLQFEERFAISAAEIWQGMSFGAPRASADINPWLTALATFGIIGVGASELIAYPYWCLEKGYARFTGNRTEDVSWSNRALGWMRVLRYDAFASMVVYTVATIAFYIMGVAVLYSEGRDPEGMRMVSTLATAYEPVFGTAAKWLFLGGAIAVLYSTFMVANAGNARMVTDAISVFGLLDGDNPRSRARSVTVLSVVLPLLCLAVYCSGANPVQLILVAGIMQAFMLPIVGFSSVYFRYRMIDERLQPGRLWDAMLIVSCIGFLIAGCFGVYKELGKYLG